MWTLLFCDRKLIVQCFHFAVLKQANISCEILVNINSQDNCPSRLLSWGKHSYLSIVVAQFQFLSVNPFLVKHKNNFTRFMEGYFSQGMGNNICLLFTCFALNLAKEEESILIASTEFNLKKVLLWMTCFYVPKIRINLVFVFLLEKVKKSSLIEFNSPNSNKTVGFHT